MKAKISEHIDGAGHVGDSEANATENAIVVGKVLVAGTSIAYWADEEEMVGWLTESFPGNVTYRRHPRRSGGFSPDRAPLDELAEQLRQALVVVSAFSTVLLEAALLGIPSCVVSFGRSAEGPDGLIVHAEYVHMREILAWPGVYVCRSYQELVMRLQYVLTGLVSEEVRRTLMARARNVADADGRCRERISEALTVYAKEGAWTRRP